MQEGATVTTIRSARENAFVACLFDRFASVKSVRFVFSNQGSLHLFEEYCYVLNGRQWRKIDPNYFIDISTQLLYQEREN